MFRGCLRVFSGVFFSMVISLCAAEPVLAQLQTVPVDCSSGTIAAALASITDRNGPNVILLNGTCAESVNVIGFNRLTIQGNPTATITKGVSFTDSYGVVLRSLVLAVTSSPAVFNSSLMLFNTTVTLDGVTVSSPNINGIVAAAQGQLFFGGAPSLITGNGGSGITVQNGVLNVSNVTISNNGNRGISAGEGAFVYLWNVNAQGAPAPVDISGNSAQGMDLEGATLKTFAPGGPASALIRIHDNGLRGVAVGGSLAIIEGHVQIDGNGGKAIGADASTLVVGNGAQIQGGLTASLNTIVVLEGDTPLTLTGGATMEGGSLGVMYGANSIDTLTCDGTSWMTNADNLSTVGSNTCPSAGPSGIKGEKGDQGIQGPPGLSEVENLFTVSAVTLGKAGTTSVSQVCPAGKVVTGGGFSSENPNFYVVASVPETTATSSRWYVQVRNTANNSQIGNVGAYAVCATVQ